ncbi:unnamed protein product, partial [Prorocentrum cordatum]
MADLAAPLDPRLGTPGEQLSGLGSGLQAQFTSVDGSPRGSLSRPLGDGGASATSAALWPVLDVGERRLRPRLLVAGESLTTTLQWYKPPRRPYTRRELLADRVVNFSGAGLSWLGLFSLVIMSTVAGDSLSKTAGYLVFGVGLVAMLNLSAFYHLLCWDWGRA